MRPATTLLASLLLCAALPLTLPTSLSAADEASRAKAKEELKSLAAEATRLSRSFNLVHDVVGPSVVAIHTKLQQPIGRRTFFGFVPSGPKQEVEVGEGSGFVIRCDKDWSYILTNSHVVLRMDESGEFARDSRGQFVKYDRVVVETNDNRMIGAEYVGWYIETDLAVLKVPTTLPAVDWGDSDQAHVGDWVVALGYPLGVGYSASAGIISATDRSTGIYRSVGGFESFIQTDAAINRGNSGGPLVDLQGRIVGVNASIMSPTRNNVGLGFAIPCNVAKLVSNDLIDHGKVRRPVIGVAIDELAAEDAQKQGLPPIPAVKIMEVTPGSPAEKAGLQNDDVVLAINNVPVVNDMQFRSRLFLCPIGMEVNLRLRRGDKTVEKNVVPMEWEEFQKTAQANKPKTIALPNFGMELAVDRNGIMLYAVDPQGPAATVGLEPGDRIQALKTKRKGVVPLKTLTDVEPFTDAKNLQILVQRDNVRDWVSLAIQGP